MNQTTPTNQPIGPIRQAERIQILDILRGFAVFGILAVNMAGFASPAFLPGYIPPAALPWYDQLAEALVLFFCEAKFYTIFSFLFGLGFSVQMARAEAKGRDIKSFYPRRLWWLLAFGILHAVLFWIGDILRIYALLGFALLAFRKRSNRTLVIWVLVLFGISFLLLGLLGGEDGGIPGFDVVAMARQVYQGDSYLNVLIFQIFASLTSFVIIFLTQGPSALALFLLGLLAGRLKFFEQLPEERAFLKRAGLVGLLVGLVGNGIYLWVEDPWLSALAITLGAPAMSTAYVGGLSLLSLGKRGARWLAPLASVGRMALTNYILQSVVCAFIFGGFGLGFYEEINAAGLLGLTFLIYLLQIPLSVWWLRHFRFGPLEWLWRSLTYRQRQPMRKAHVAA
ncbi:MAG: DUF418 domain-containing protein [Anaerolineales bacterium]|nr:DUF418 domain-containing protein [Anaerolineales bacterium]